MVTDQMSENRAWTRETMKLPDGVSRVLTKFIEWLHRYGETSWDHQSFFAGVLGRTAKSLYYKNSIIGTAAVGPMIFFEAFLPSGRRLFHHPTRFPIADAHYAMGFAFLCQATGDFSQLENAVHFLNELKRSRCSQFKEYCWGYPFDWVTRNGTIRSQTPLITSTPYAYEAFLHVHELDGREEWKDVIASIARNSTSRILRHRRLQVVVPTHRSTKAELLTLLRTAPFC